MLCAYSAGLAAVVVTVVVVGCGVSPDAASPTSEALQESEYTDAEASYSYAEDEMSSEGGGSVTGGQLVDMQPAPSVRPARSAQPEMAAEPNPAALPAPAASARTSKFAVSPPHVKENLVPSSAGDAVQLTERFRRNDVHPIEGHSGDRFDQIIENGFLSVHESPLSTFSIDVDTASYAKTRMFLQQRNELPPPDAVRIEELVNYFEYEYSPPTGDDPFAVHMEVARAPWKPQHLLARVGIKGREMERRPASNLVFLVDVSGSMNRPNKLGLVKQGLQLLCTRLNKDDRVSIVVYAGAAGLVLPPTPGDNRLVVMDAVQRLSAGGSTNGAEGIQLAYRVAQQNFVKGGVNRVLLCTDGDFNVGTTNTGDLIRLAAGQASEGVFLSVLGFGMGNHNDAMLEELSNKANGNYAFIDSDREARKVLLDQLDSTLVTIAKDVKIQIEFNPLHVASYRLIGYENRRLADRDFNDDKKDAGEIGAGHSVTALYELVPADGQGDTPDPQVDPLKYQVPRKLADAADSDDLLNLKLRFKRPHNDRSELAVFPIKNAPLKFGEATKDFQFAAAVAEFGMLLRNSRYRGDASYAEVLEIAISSRGQDSRGYRTEFLQVVTAARRLVEPDAVGSAPTVLPHIAYEVPHQYVATSSFSQHDLKSTMSLLLVVAGAVWMLMAVIGCILVAWAVVARQSRQAWQVGEKPVTKVVHSPLA